MKLRLETLELRENPSVVFELPQLEAFTAFVDSPPTIDDPANWTVPGPFVPPPPPPPPILETPVTPTTDKFPLPPPVPTGPG